MNVFHNQSFPNLRSHLVLPLVSQLCRTFASMWDLQCSLWNSDCFGNSFQWIPLIPLLRTKTFPKKKKNVLVHLLQHWKFFSVFFTLDYSPDSRMILILQAIPIMFLSFPWRNFEVLPLLEIWYYQVTWSVKKCFSVPYGLRGSVKKNFLVIRSKFSYHFPSLSGRPDQS